MTDRAMTLDWQPYREPLRATLLRTGAIAAGIGAVIAYRWHAGLTGWVMATLLALWPAFGGHWVELWFLNWLRPRLPNARGVQAAARLLVWFVGGVILSIGMTLTAVGLGIRSMRWNAAPHVALVGGLGFIGIELIVHLALQLRGRPSLYNGRG